MTVYDVDLPNGKTIQVQGPDDATDDELIAIARTHPSLAKQSTKPPAETSGAGMKPGQVPELSTPDQLLKDAKASTPGLKANIPGAFEATQNTTALPTAGGLYDLLSQGDIKGAYNSLPQNVRDVTEIGAPLGAAALVGKQAYNLYQSGKEGNEGSQGIKSRTIGADSAPTQTATAPAAPAEPALSPKEAKIATEIENKYGFNWKDVKNNFNVSNVPITDPTQAEILASAYKNQQVSPQAPTVAPEVASVAAAPVETPAPIAEAPKAAPPPVEAPKAVQPPPSVEASLGKPTLTTGSGMPAYEGQGAQGGKLAHKKGVFENVTQIPKDYVFVPGGQNMDIVRNAVGQPEYTKNLKSSGGYPASPQTAYEQSREINKSLGRATRAEAKASGAAMPEPTPSITQKIAGSKTVKVAGVTGALILASDLANAAQEGAAAAQQGDRQMATGYLTDILGALSGPIGYTASQVLGTSPEDLKVLRAAEQARKVGAGRGIAPPSAYQR